jgi:hypothetical protein
MSIEPAWEALERRSIDPRASAWGQRQDGALVGRRSLPRYAEASRRSHPESTPAGSFTGEPPESPTTISRLRCSASGNRRYARPGYAPINKKLVLSSGGTHSSHRSRGLLLSAPVQGSLRRWGIARAGRVVSSKHQPVHLRPWTLGAGLCRSGWSRPPRAEGLVSRTVSVFPAAPVRRWQMGAARRA